MTTFRNLGSRTRATAAATALALGLTSTDCVVHRWRAIPVTQLSLEQERIPSKRVVFTTDTGSVTMKVRLIDYPYVSGQVEGGDGTVEFDVRTASSAERLQPSAGGVAAVAIPLTESALSETGSTDVRFRTTAGPVVLTIERVAFPYVEGRLRTKDSIARIDLRRVREAKVEGVSVAKTIAANAGIGAGVFFGALLIVFLTKESCPFVYVDLGQGLELIGEAYAGAALRSIQRNDLLPLPVLSGDRARLQLRNEARETQYTDHVALVLVDHPSHLRALSTFDGTPILVGPSSNATSSRAEGNRDVSGFLSDRDHRLWETDMAAAAAADGWPLSEEVEATFERPVSGQPILEIVAGNTSWLDLTVGRYFAAMGDHLAGYLAIGNDPASAPALQTWREREGIDLLVELWQGGTWQPVATVPTVGPAALREIAVPLPAGHLDDASPLRVRLRSGLGFWRLDRIGLSTREQAPHDIHHLSPTVARARGNRDQRRIVASVDRQYDALSEMGQALDLEFDLPKPPSGQTRSAFLFTNGYYNVHPPVQGAWSPLTLMTIRDEPGSFARFSRDLAREYVRLAQTTPVWFRAAESP